MREIEEPQSWFVTPMDRNESGQLVEGSRIRCLAYDSAVELAQWLVGGFPGAVIIDAKSGERVAVFGDANIRDS